MWIFGKVWGGLGLVWKMLGDLGGEFWSYLEAPNSYIITNPNFGPTKQKMAQTIPHSYPHTWGSIIFSTHTVWGLCWLHSPNRVYDVGVLTVLVKGS